MSDVNPYEAPTPNDGDGQPVVPWIYWSCRDLPGLSDLSRHDAHRLWRKVGSSMYKQSLRARLSLLLFPIAIVSWLAVVELGFSEVLRKPLVVWLPSALIPSFVGVIHLQIVGPIAIPIIRAERERMAQEQRDADATEQAFRESAVTQ